MSCQGGLDGYLSSLAVANFSDHHHIWVLAERRTQPFRKSVTLFIIGLSLGYARQVVFDRVLNGYYFYFRGINLSQKCVKSSSFSIFTWIDFGSKIRITIDSP